MYLKFGRLNKKIALRYVIFLMTIGFLAWLNLYFLIDELYKSWFLHAQSLSVFQAITFYPENKDPAYFLLQNTMSVFVNFPIFFICIISLSLLLKLTALLSVEKDISLLHVLPYLFVLSFLHEGIQVRIALALSFALWAIIMYARKKWLLSFVLLLVGGTFHLSALTFLIVSVAMILHDRLGHRLIYVTIFLTLLFSMTSTVPDVMHFIGRATNARFMAYAENFYAYQNKSGLFQYFFILIGVLTAFVWRYHQPSTELWSQLKKVGLTSACLAIVILMVFHFNVVVSSRLADLLLLPLLLVLGATLHQLMQQGKWPLLGGMTLMLIGYGILRGIVSFKPQIIPDIMRYLNSLI